MPGKASWGQPQIPGTIAVLEKFRLSRQWLGVEVSGAYLNSMNAREGVMGDSLENSCTITVSSMLDSPLSGIHRY